MDSSGTMRRRLAGAVAALVLVALVVTRARLRPADAPPPDRATAEGSDASAELVPSAPTLAARPSTPSNRRRSTGAGDASTAAPDVRIGPDVVDPILQAKVRLVDGATGRVLGVDDLDGRYADGFSSSLGGTTTVFLVLPRSTSWVAVDEPLHEIELRVGFASARPLDAREALVVWPLYRATEIRLRVSDGGGGVRADARAVGWSGLGRSVPVDVAASADGIVRLSGIPFLPRERLSITVETSQAASSNRSPATDAATLRIRSIGHVVLPDEWAPVVESTFSIAEPRDLPVEATLADHVEVDTDLLLDASTIRIHSTRRDGTPASGATLRIAGGLAYADAEGRATAKIRTGFPLSISLADPTLVPTTVVVTPKSGETLDVDLREPEPASLEVAVVFADGRPVPFAHLTVTTPSGIAPFDLVDGLLRLDPFTGVDGRRVYTRVEPANVHVAATWGTRFAVTDVPLVRAVRGSVRLTLPDFPRDDLPPDGGVREEPVPPVVFEAPVHSEPVEKR